MANRTKGSFTQTGGSHTVKNTLYVGYSSSDFGKANGTYTLRGTGQLQAANEFIGYRGVGSFIQEGGNHQVTNTLTLAAFKGATGDYTLRGGQLQAGTLRVNPGGTFIQEGGILTVNKSTSNRGQMNLNRGLATFHGPMTNEGQISCNSYSPTV